MTTISPEQVEVVPGERTNETFTVSTTDREVPPEVEEIVRGVIAASLRLRTDLYAGMEVSVSAVDEDSLMAEGYRALADEMLHIAHETRSVQLRALPRDE